MVSVVVSGNFDGFEKEKEKVDSPDDGFADEKVAAGAGSLDLGWPHVDFQLIF